ncbi:hypothetical protein VNI00_010303 [Paramarasmius palmivorus]|uniref:Zn(2)-C6 fungal-type domain-containing protein n=1 Tax=Paramarasmius palmivorus TaxID=297713 RepID=A0AAW0CL33_9AGAR
MSSASPEASAPPKRIIRPHPKVRTGCKTCKKRRIKCDEHKPLCNNCAQRCVPCVWKENTGNNQGISKDKGQTKVKKGGEEVRARALVSSSPQLLKQPTGQLDVITLELVHHYTVFSYSSFCSDAKFSITCRNTIPTLSFTSPFLRHAMFSSTALHLGHLYPPDSPKRHEWLTRAFFHRKTALDVQTITTSDSHDLSANSDTQYIGICFLTIYAISSSLHTSPSNIFGLLTILHNVWSKLTKFMYQDPELGAIDPISHSDVPVPIPLHLKQIYEYIPNDPSLPDPSELKDPEVAKAYKSAADILIHTFYPLSQTGLEMMGVIQWPAFFPKRFCDLLNQRKQRALVLLYCYLVVLGGFGEKLWWACDMGRCADHVYGLLNPEWRMWLKRGWVYSDGYGEDESAGVVVSIVEC